MVSFTEVSFQTFIIEIQYFRYFFIETLTPSIVKMAVQEESIKCNVMYTQISWQYCLFLLKFSVSFPNSSPNEVFISKMCFTIRGEISYVCCCS